MYKSKHFIGVDISKDTFDVWNLSTGHHCYSNDLKGFRSFYRLMNIDTHCVIEGKLINSLKRQLKQLRKEIVMLEEEIESLIIQYNGDLFQNIISIPGIGKKTAVYLIIITNGFQTFENYRQVSAFFGLAPTEHTSGTSINGHSKISKRGNSHIRNHLQ